MAIWISPSPLNCPRGLCMTPYLKEDRYKGHAKGKHF